MATTAERIATVAKELLTQEGSAAVSTRRVAAAIGVTPMALYRHFPNRDALMTHIADECFATLAEEWAQVELPTNFAEALRASTALFVDFALTQPHLYAFLFLEVRPGARVFPRDFDAGHSPTFRVITKLIETGISDGQLRADDPWRVGLTITATLQGLIQLHQGGRIGLSDDEFRELCFDTTTRIFNGLKQVPHTLSSERHGP